MITNLIAFLLSAVVAVLCTPVVLIIARRIGALDVPGERRMSDRIVPRLGGAAILMGFFSPMVALLFMKNDIALHVQENFSKAVAVLGGALVLAILGALDDVRGVRAAIKLLVQIAVAVFAWGAGFRIDEIVLPFLGSFDTVFVSLPLTVIWLVGIINAVNLIDGLDGLAAGVAFMVCVVNFVVGSLAGNLMVALLSASLGGALLGFLVFNFNPARIYMGDTGSMMIGYVLAATSIVGAKGSTAVGLVVPVIALGLPIVDTLVTVVRRIWSRRSIFVADRGHIHHKLLDMGMTHRRAVLILYGASVVFTVAAIGIYLGKNWEVGVTLLVASLVIVALIRTARFSSIRTGVSDRGRQYSGHVELVRQALPKVLRGVYEAQTIQGVFDQLKDFGEQTNLQSIECELPGCTKDDAWRWSCPDSESMASGRRGQVQAGFPVELGDAVKGSVKFTWTGDSWLVSPRIEIVLQLLVDELEKSVVRIEDTGAMPPVGADREEGEMSR